MPICKALEILRSEAYLLVRCNDERREERGRGVFFRSLLRISKSKRADGE
jgi:hypothetical protein